MNQFIKNNDNLKLIIKNIVGSYDENSLSNAVDLDSIDAVLRSYLSLSEMKEAGSFFTGQEMASVAVNSFRYPISSSSIVLDPTCGAGNLLIECSRKIEVEKSLSETLTRWGKILYGFDLHASFVEAAKLRLIIEALKRGSRLDCDIEKALLLLPNIKVEDAMLVQKNDLINITHLILNPPFTRWPSPNTGFWKKGKVSAAGLIVEHYLKNSPENCCFNAILPDVLRSGSRYENFRNFVSTNLSAQCRILGRFNSKTDVDVFLLSGKVEKIDASITWFTKLNNRSSLSDYFDVCIGPLVAYRDPENGKKYPYIHAKNIGKWQEITNIEEERQFSGKVIAPPFVVIKRTSSPSDKDRAVASIVSIKDSAVAVENHLIVVKPKSGKLIDCKRLIKVLSSEKTNCFLNDRVRMRHLTVGVIKSIPFA